MSESTPNPVMTDAVHDLLEACEAAATVLAFVPCRDEQQRKLLQDVYDKCMAAASKAKGKPFKQDRIDSRGVEEVAAWLFDEAECTIRMQPDTCLYQWAVEDNHGNVIAEGHTMVEAIMEGERVASQYV